MSSEYFERLFVAAIFVFSALIRTGHGQDFGYDGNIGPTHWGEKFQRCVGKHQSPINIEEHNVRTVQLPSMLFQNFNHMPTAYKLKNNGHTVVAAVETDKKPTITGGPLISDYEFVQFHFHWGANDDEGSENTINNSSFPLELHMVFYDKDYGSLQEAQEHPDGLAVLSILFSSCEENNTNYQALLHSLSFIQDPNTTTTLQNPPSLNQLMPNDLSVYFTYGGSLTTPPCLEVVTWIEFRNTVLLAHEQIDQFRHLNNAQGRMIHNFRPVQPLHGRIIRMHQASNDDQLQKKSKLPIPKAVSKVPNEVDQRNSAYTLDIEFNILKTTLTLFGLLILVK